LNIQILNSEITKERKDFETFGADRPDVEPCEEFFSAKVAAFCCVFRSEE
jgi:hypothetical protein